MLKEEKNYAGISGEKQLKDKELTEASSAVSGYVTIDAENAIVTKEISGLMGGTGAGSVRYRLYGMFDESKKIVKVTGMVKVLAYSTLTNFKWNIISPATLNTAFSPSGVGISINTYIDGHWWCAPKTERFGDTGLMGYGTLFERVLGTSAYLGLSRIYNTAGGFGSWEQQMIMEQAMDSSVFVEMYFKYTTAPSVSGLNTDSNEMSNSEINQSKLTYRCGAGKAFVNVATGEPEYELPIVNIGANDYAVGIGLVYRKAGYFLSDGIKTCMGNCWKLNVQQYLFKKSEKYFYVDGSGNVYHFDRLEDGRYYDTSGLGLILTVGSFENVISDQFGNKMHFSGGVLVRTESCHNSNANKYYKYENGKLSSVYDGRTSENKIQFSYNSVGLLSEIKCSQANEERKSYRFYYDTDEKLVRLEKHSGENTKDVALFKYYGATADLLHYAVNAEDKSALCFEYDSTAEKKRVIRVGTGRVSEDFSIASETVDFKTKTSNVFSYKTENGGHNRTAVINEKGVEAVYYLNEKGLTTCILEAHERDEENLQVMEKRPGVSVMGDSTGNIGEKINLCKAIKVSEESTWTANTGAANKYRKNKYAGCQYFSFSFWLKILDRTGEEPKITLTVQSDNKTNTGIASFDNTAENAWQLITIPIEISGQDIKKIELKAKGCFSYQIADMRFYVNQFIRFCVRAGEDSAPLEEFTSVKYKIPAASGYTEKRFSDGCYMTEKDLQATYYSMATSGKNTFVLSLCDNTERHVVESVKLYHPLKQKDFSLNLPSNGLAQFYQEIISSDNKTKVTGDVYFGYDENGNKFSGICQRTKAESDKKSSSAYVYVDYKGLLKKERDEYGVETEYKYDSYGRQLQKIISHADTAEKLVYETLQSSSSATESTATGEFSTTFDELFGTVTDTKYNGKNETGNVLTTKYSYDGFGERLSRVENDAGEKLNKNELFYDENGRLKEVTPTDSSSLDYGYGFKYNEFGDPIRCSNPNNSNQLLTEKEISYTDGTLKDKKYRKSKTEADETLVMFDKYGRTREVREKSYGESNKITLFTRQDLSESAGVSEVAEMYDPYENRTYKYSYDDGNNLTGYEIKNEDSSNFLSIKKTGENKISYTMSSNNIGYDTEVTYDGEKLLSPRVTKTIGLIPVGVEDHGMKYTYDELGRIKKKNHYMRGLHGETTTVNTDIEYKSGTTLKESYAMHLSGVCTFKYDYKYNARGLVTKCTFDKVDYNNGTSATETKTTQEYTYTYDKADRLATENNGSRTITYSYNEDGSIAKELSTEGITKEYAYKDGRLIFIENAEKRTLKDCTYDNIGNCIQIWDSNGTTYLEWERGGLLKSYKDTATNRTKYYYNSQGIRYKKEKNSYETRYYLDGEKLLLEELNDRQIIYSYDEEGITGFYYKNLDEKDSYWKAQEGTYQYVKDGQGNVVAILNETKEIARYEYDTWGNCTIVKDENGIGALNPIRWRSQYYDVESGFYYIGGRYYSPELKQYISARNPETALANAGTVYGLNLYLLCLTNPVNMVYNGYTIEPNAEMVYDPEELSGWSYFWKYTWKNFWKSPYGKSLSIRLFVAATVLAIACPAFAPIYLSTVIGVGVSLGIGAAIAGYRSMRGGGGFWDSFANYINDNWAQEVAISFALSMLAFGISQAAQAIGGAGGNKAPANSTQPCGRECFKAGTKVLCRDENGEESHKPIEEIKVGDIVWSYDEETGESDWKPVVRLFRNQTKEWYHVFIDGEEIICTGGHPFYVAGRGFVKARELTTKDKLTLSDGKQVAIEKIEIEKLDKPETTYNFEVEDFHTYYVSDCKVLVHNMCHYDEAMEIYSSFDIDSAYVKPKHLSTTGGNGAKFIGGSKLESEVILKNAMRKGEVIQTAYNGITAMGNPSYSYILNAGQIIGTRGQTHIYLVLAKGGGMLTAYPIIY